MDQNLNVRVKTIKFTLNIYRVKILQWFLRFNTKNTGNKKINKMNFNKIKRFFFASKNTTKKYKKQLMEWENIFATHILDKKPLFKYVKNSYTATI